MAEAATSSTPDVWGRVLGAALKLPAVRIDRESFLRRELGKYVPESVVADAVVRGPGPAGVPSETVETIASATIGWHRASVSALAAVLAMPPGWWNAATLPADVVQFFAQVLMVSQKLAYLYGWPELIGDGVDDVDDDSRLVLTLFVGVALGSNQAARGLAVVAERLGAEVVKRLPREALTKWAIYRVAKEVAKWIGVRLTKRKFAEILARGIPVVGAVIAGGVTWVSFSTMAHRLRAHLAGLPIAGFDGVSD